MLAEALRTFYMVRSEDVSGVSGTGKVGEVVVFSDGTTVVRWLTDFRSTAIYASLADAERIHGHDGRTRFVPLVPIAAPTSPAEETWHEIVRELQASKTVPPASPADDEPLRPLYVAHESAARYIPEEADRIVLPYGTTLYVRNAANSGWVRSFELTSPPAEPTR